MGLSYKQVTGYKQCKGFGKGRSSKGSMTISRESRNEAFVDAFQTSAGKNSAAI